MTVKEYLGQARYLDLLINTKLEQIMVLREQDEKVKLILEDEQKQEEMSREFVKLQDEAEEEIKRLIELRKEIIVAIEFVDDMDGRLILEKHFLNGQTYSDIALDMHMSEKTVYRIQKKALERIFEVMYPYCQ